MKSARVLLLMLSVSGSVIVRFGELFLPFCSLRAVTRSLALFGGDTCTETKLEMVTALRERQGSNNSPNCVFVGLNNRAFHFAPNSTFSRYLELIPCHGT